jgi:Wzt-like putative exopolysaccharide export protein
LKNVADFCQSSLLLEKGRVLVVGSAQEVISSYLKRNRSTHSEDPDTTPLRISKVTVRNQKGECLRFDSGEKAWIDVELCAFAHCRKLSVSIYILNGEHQSIFDTSTERMGHGNFTLDRGDQFTCTFELQLNMANGVFYPSILVYRYDTQTEYDRWEAAAAIHISSQMDVRGSVHCFPKVIRQEVRTGQAAHVALTAGTTPAQAGAA